MEFTECVKDKLTLTLKSGLLCAVTLMPATVLAQSLETARGEEATNLTNTVTVATATTEQPRVSLIPADTASAAALAHQRKITRLSGHIQSRYRVPEHKAQQIVAAAIRSGEIHQVDPELILAIIAVESTFKERAVSRVGARGLMQVMPGSHSRKIREIGGSHALFDPATNIHTGSRILASYLDDHSGDLRRALLNYNGSLGNRSSFPEKVLRIYRDLRRVTVEG
ncbi:MAG: lytic transglycosylase domain-containing protein [Candidatus Competibacteraceae bacterium]